MDSEELLAQLADIHLPEPVSYWPPAPGWWILALFLLVGVALLAFKIAAANRRRRIRDQALNELTKCYDRFTESEASTDSNAAALRFVNEANSVFKRVSLYHFPNSDVAGLGGAHWIDFLKQAGKSDLLDDSLADALSFGRFQTSLEVDCNQLNEFGQQWISSLYENTEQSLNSASRRNAGTTSLDQEVTP